MKQLRALHIVPAVLVVFFVAVFIWPSWTLSYTRALAWPIVVIGALALFGPKLAERIGDILELGLPGGVKAKFREPTSQPTTTPREEAAVIAKVAADRADLAAAWGAPLDIDGDAAPEIGETNEVDPVAAVALPMLTFISGAFQMQLDFLRVLHTATGGLSAPAAEEWFTAALAARELENWNVPKLLEWLVTSGAIRLDDDLRYRLQPFGDLAVALIDTTPFWYAPKAH